MLGEGQFPPGSSFLEVRDWHVGSASRHPLRNNYVSLKHDVRAEVPVSQIGLWGLGLGACHV